MGAFHSYLVKNPSSYCFRITVPPDLVVLIGRKEIRYSLRTWSLREAKYRARRMAAHVQTIFRIFRRNGGDVMAEISEVDF